MFVGGLAPQTTPDDLFRYFTNLCGGVRDARVAMDQQTGRPRKFGFVFFGRAGIALCCTVLFFWAAHHEAVRIALAGGGLHDILGKRVECKLAIPKAAAGAPCSR